MNGKPEIRILEGSSLPLGLLSRRWPKAKGLNSELLSYVNEIIREVRGRGDQALIEFEERFDGVKLSADSLLVSRGDFEEAYEKVSDELVSAIKFSKSRVEAFQKEMLRRIRFEYKENGLRIVSSTSPIRRVGCYVPGGGAAYPSSVVMMATPAKVAGVQEIALCSPPRSGGEVDPSVLVAADICGVDEVYRLGGVQAIAALAYGTMTVRPVDKIFGPGNRYVQAAKILVSKDVPIDFPAGPSEIVIIADGSVDPRILALDMISQAEHLDGVSVLLTTSRRLAESVAEEIKRNIESSPNRRLLSKNLSGNSLILVCRSLEEAVRIVNEFAPEHLEVMTEDPWRISEKITSAGLILVGRNTPVAVSDYCLGTVHVLPTGGFSHVYSGLSVLDFVKRFCIAECSAERLREARDRVRALAESEGLLNHSLAVEERFSDE
jgi:histidinol dehydrogenase